MLKKFKAALYGSFNEEQKIESYNAVTAVIQTGEVNLAAHAVVNQNGEEVIQIYIGNNIGEPRYIGEVTKHGYDAVFNSIIRQTI